MRIALILALAACGKGGDKPAGDPAMPAGALDKLAVTVSGEPLKIDRALIKRTAPDVYTMLLGAGAGSCAELLDGKRRRHDGARSFGLTFAKRVEPNGVERYVVVDVWSRDIPISIKQRADVTFEGSAAAGTTATIGGLDLADGEVFTARGSLVAIGCGEVAPAGLGLPKVAHPAKAVITIAGKTPAIQGVVVAARSGVAATDAPDIRISTGPLGCAKVPLLSQVLLERIDGRWRLSGSWLPGTIEEVDAAASGLTFSANEVGNSVDGPTLKLQLSGSGQIGDYRVELGGTAEAIDCGH